jgi:hypothetical protein
VSTPTPDKFNERDVRSQFYKGNFGADFLPLFTLDSFPIGENVPITMHDQAYKKVSKSNVCREISLQTLSKSVPIRLTMIDTRPRKIF